MKYNIENIALKVSFYFSGDTNRIKTEVSLKPVSVNGG